MCGQFFLLRASLYVLSKGVNRVISRTVSVHPNPVSTGSSSTAARGTLSASFSCNQKGAQTMAAALVRLKTENGRQEVEATWWLKTILALVAIIPTGISALTAAYALTPSQKSTLALEQSKHNFERRKADAELLKAAL